MGQGISVVLLVTPLANGLVYPQGLGHGLFSRVHAKIQSVTVPLDTFEEGVYYGDKLCEEEKCDLPDSNEFTIGIIGDLHIDPRVMDDYYSGREHFVPIFDDAKNLGVNAALVSLGDLGESKSVRPDETQELFAGTTECHDIAAEFLSSFGVPYEVIGGNHDLEGIDEFSTDAENLDTFMRIHDKPTPHFSRVIAEKTLLVGLCSTVFRSAKFTSHEVTIDDDQLKWFEKTVTSHPAEDGWKIFVFSHAPPIGSGLRVLQENHVVNGCCWLNHSGGASTTKFIELVRKHRCIKAWFSGHFHLGQDYEDSITFPSTPVSDGPYPNRGSCVFAQTSVMRSGTSRDGRQQSRLVRGNKDGFEICTVDHRAGGKIRLDATITYTDSNHEVGAFAHEHAELTENENFMRVYSPIEGDECFVDYDESDSLELDPVRGACVDEQSVAWWRMSGGRVLGIYDGRLVEYDSSTLAPLGLVVGFDELKDKRVVVIGSKEDGCSVENSQVSRAVGYEGVECMTMDGEEQAVLLVDDTNQAITVVQPNEDGSYWRKIVRNKMVRMKEKRRQEAGEAYSQLIFKDSPVNTVSSWGPYTSISGTATTTGVPGLTKEAKDAWKSFGAGNRDVLGQARKHLRSIFENVDHDRSGRIDREELGEAVKLWDPTIDEETIDVMFRDVQMDGDDATITFNQFVMAMLFA